MQLVLITFLASVHAIQLAQPLQNLFAQTTCESKVCDNPFEVDGQGYTWVNFCFTCPQQDQQPIFLKRQSAEGWTYYIDPNLGDPKYEYRILIVLKKCQGEETDAQGQRWQRWCYPDGTPVAFEKCSGSKWTYIVDTQGGYSQFQYRRFYNPVSEQQPIVEEPIQESWIQMDDECHEVEGDNSGRYFFVSYDNLGNKITYRKDAKGNYILHPMTKQRLPVFLEGADSSWKPCQVYDQQGNQIQLEPDQLLEGVFWKVDTNNGKKIDYLYSKTASDRRNGMYLLSQTTGRRLRDFEDNDE